MADQLTVGAGVRRARRAVEVIFLLNAVSFANVVPRLPAIKADMGLSNTSLGTAVAAMPAGALLAGLTSGGLVHRFGSGRVAVACGVAFGAVLQGFALAPSWGVLAAVFLIFGAVDSVMDVSMNAHALRVQRAVGRSIINALHGMWSIGAVAGGAIGALAVAAGLGLGAHLAVAGAAVAAIALLVRGWVLPGSDDADRIPVAADGRPRTRSARGRLLVLGLVVVLSSAIEDAPQSWGAVFLREDLDASGAVAGMVFVAFQASMTASRFVGDRLVERYGERAVVAAGGLVTAIGTGAGLAIGTVPSVIAGFALAGAGTAALYPLVFHGAGDVEGVATGRGVAVVSWMGRVGFLVAAPLVGVIGDAAGLRVGLLVVPTAGLAVAALSGPAFGRGRPRQR